MLDFLLGALTPLNILLALAGVAAGTIIGSIPGLTATMAVAVLVPLTFAMPPDSALILMGAIYTGAIYGGAYAAILLNTPGTPSAIATTFDGFPMAKRGDGDLAVSLACLASVGGGLVGALALLFLAPPLAKAALAFGPIEYFWLAVFGLSLISALSEGAFLKGMMGACFGLLLATIGVSETSAEVRFTFGSQTLLGGIEVVSALIGLYCVPVLIDLVARPERHLEPTGQGRGFRLGEAFAILFREKWNLLRSSAIGTFVGALPGAGGSIAGLISYSEARRASRRRAHYGQGEPGGVIATESANNATVGGGFIPTLVLGIPGTPPDAVILGALLVQGVRTGPTLFAEGGSVVYTFIFGLLIATILMLPVGLLVGRFAYTAILKAPKAVLVPIVAFMTVIGAFAIRNSLSDVVVMIVLGVVGWLANRRGFSVSPIVLGLILGRIAEEGFVQGWTIGSALDDLTGQFFGRPIALAIIAMTALTFFYPLVPGLKRSLSRRRERKVPVGRELGFIAFLGACLDHLVVAAVGLLVLFEAQRLNDDAAVFPETVAMALLVFVGLGLLRLIVFRRGEPEQPGGSWPRRIALPAFMLGGVALVPILGFGTAGVAMGLGLLLVALHERPSVSLALRMALSVVAVILAVTYAFRDLLSVPLPSGGFY